MGKPSSAVLGRVYPILKWKTRRYQGARHVSQGKEAGIREREGVRFTTPQARGWLNPLLLDDYFRRFQSELRGAFIDIFSFRFHPSILMDHLKLPMLAQTLSAPKSPIIMGKIFDNYFKTKFI
jgi:hypothetical protein